MTGLAKRKWERRQRHRLTLEGLVFIGITFAIGLAAFNTGTNLLYLICAMLLSFLILSGVVSTQSLRGLHLARSAPRQAVAGEPCRIEVALRNTKRWTTSYSIRVVDRLESGEVAGTAYFVAVAKRGMVHESYRTIFPTRGVFRLARLAVTSRFPFGLIERSWGEALRHEILVYPRLVDVRPILGEAEVDLGDVESNRRGPGTSLYQLREYSGRESSRLIHWKTSAKTGRLMVMEHEREEKRRVSLFLNNTVEEGTPDGDLEERFERGVVLAASLARFLLERDHQVQLVTGSGKVPFGTGVSHLHRCLRALARIELMGRQGPPFHLPAPEADCVNVVVHFDPGREDSRYTASAVVLGVERWWEQLNPVVDEDGEEIADRRSQISGGGSGKGEDEEGVKGVKEAKGRGEAGTA